MSKIFFIDEVRELVHKYFEQEISIGKLTDLLNERAVNAVPGTLTGRIIKHLPAGEIYGGVAVETPVGNFAVSKRNQEVAHKNIGAKVIVSVMPDFYKTVEIVDYPDGNVVL